MSHIQLDQQTKRPKKIRGYFPIQTFRILGDMEVSSERIKNFLKENAKDLKLTSSLDNLELVHDVNLSTKHIFRFQEKIGSIPILGGLITVEFVDNNHIQQIDIQHTGSMKLLNPTGDISISASEALGLILQQLENPQLRLEPVSPKKIYFPTEQGLRLGYLAEIATQNPPHDWKIIIDSTGQILSKEDVIRSIPDGLGFVFDPNPVVSSGNKNLRDPEATTEECDFSGSERSIIDAERVIKPLRDITLSQGQYRLEGTYCEIYNFGAPNTIGPQENSADGFKYSSGDLDRRFEAVNIYYHIDTLQRYIQRLGITNVNNRRVKCDPYDNSNLFAWYSPFDKGLHFSNSGKCKPDRGEDAHVIYHEYGHAMQDDQVPEWGSPNPTTGLRETQAMGEGFGDILACVYFAPDHPFQQECFESWIFSDNFRGCLRRVDGDKRYPDDWNEESVHSSGEIWSGALWKIYQDIGGDSVNVSDREAARDALLKSLILSHFSVSGNGSMQDGAEALMITHAEILDYRGKYLMEILNSFHNCGLLFCSSDANLSIHKDTNVPYIGVVTEGELEDFPNIWIRNNNDNGNNHQDPKDGQDNWFYARVYNQGTATARAFIITFNVKPLDDRRFNYPDDFIPFISATVGFNLNANDSTTVKAKWPSQLVPSRDTNYCLLVSIYTPVKTTIYQLSFTG